MTAHVLIEDIKLLKDGESQSNLKKYDFELIERIILRLDAISECAECKVFMNEFSSVIGEMKNDSSGIINKSYMILRKKVLAHLEKNHQLITQGYYTSIYMAYGVSFGLTFGASFALLLGELSYMGLGLPIGIGIGVSIGAKLDAKAKNGGLII